MADTRSVRRNAAGVWEPVGGAFDGGLYANMPAVGTASKSVYFATDFQGGALFQDLTAGGAYTQVSKGMGATGGVRLNKVTSTSNVVMSVSATDVDVIASFPFTVGSRTVEIRSWAFMSNATAGGTCLLKVTDTSNVELSRGMAYSPTANAGVAVVANTVEVSTPGSYVYKLRCSSNNTGLATVYGGSAAWNAWLSATEV